MPLWYTGIIEEHNAVRNAAGLFDVSHMGRFLLEGGDSTRFLDYVLPTDVSRLREGRAFYSTICNQRGGIVDDIIANKFSSSEYLIVVNAANREKDFDWLNDHLPGFSARITDVSDSTALIAFQGPISLPILQRMCNIDLGAVKRFSFARCKIHEIECLVSRTGYTGEDGFEITVYDTPVDDPEKALLIWEKILEAGKNQGVLPCGLGARDSLRLEAGMCLYGQDIDDTTTPIEAGLESVVSLSKSEKFVGEDVIEKQAENGVERKRVAFLLSDSGIPRHGYEIKLSGNRVGVVTSGSFSPTIKKGIGMGYVPPLLSETGSRFSIDVRGSEKGAEVVSPPFYDPQKFGFKRNLNENRDKRN